MKIRGFSGNFSKFFDNLPSFGIKYVFQEVNIHITIQRNHSSFENGLAFVLIMPSYASVAQNVKKGVKNPSFFIQMDVFLNFFCGLVQWELDQDIWQIFFK